MRYLTHFLTINLLLGIAAGGAFGQARVSSCLEQGKKEFSAEKYTQAKNTFLRCLRADKNNEEVLLSLGGVCLVQEDLEEAKQYFLTALKRMKRTSPYLSYTYSMLGDIALKQKNNKAALAYYNKSLSYNEAYVNSLVGKGVITEMSGNKKAAAEIYQTALAVEPLNLIARNRLIALEPVYFSDAEILEALKQRYAISPDKNQLSDQDRELFLKMHAAEQNGGITYLKEKYPQGTSNYIAELFQNTKFSREVLTLAGYNTIRKQVAQDAIAVFRKAGVSMQDVFLLRDLKGNKIFLPDSTLTENGLRIYREALNGRKAYLLPSEDVPPTQAYLAEIDALIKELKQKGYVQISHKELAMLQQRTNCSEETLRSRMGLYSLEVSPHDKRYYVIARSVTDPFKGISWYYVAKTRARQNPAVIVPDNPVIKRYAWMTICSSVTGEVLE